MRTSNPFLKEKVFESTNSHFTTESEVMTLNGTVNKSLILLITVILTAGVSWYFTASNVGLIYPLMLTGAIGGLIMAIVTSYNPSYSPTTAPIYAVLEGLFLGTVSMVLNYQYPGIVSQAVLLTSGVAVTMLMAYKAGLISATEQFKSGIIAATGGIFMVYLVSWIMGMFGIQIPFIHSNGIWGIGFSLFVVVIAALNLILDFDFIEKNSQYGAPKYMEWYGAFGLLVTLVWLYIEILRLLSKLYSRD
jgi:uncharacterized YccA/Bax inhibitor family protein